MLGENDCQHCFFEISGAIADGKLNGIALFSIGLPYPDRELPGASSLSPPRFRPQIPMQLIFWALSNYNRHFGNLHDGIRLRTLTYNTTCVPCSTCCPAGVCPDHMIRFPGILQSDDVIQPYFEIVFRVPTYICQFRTSSTSIPALTLILMVRFTFTITPGFTLIVNLAFGVFTQFIFNNLEFKILIFLCWRTSSKYIPTRFGIAISGTFSSRPSRKSPAVPGLQ